VILKKVSSASNIACDDGSSLNVVPIEHVSMFSDLAAYTVRFSDWRQPNALINITQRFVVNFSVNLFFTKNTFDIVTDSPFH